MYIKNVKVTSQGGVMEFKCVQNLWLYLQLHTETILFEFRLVN